MTDRGHESDRPAAGGQPPPVPAERALDDMLSDASERDLLVKRYLLGYLSEAEAEAFEERFVRDPALLDELEEAECMVEGFRELQRDGTLARLREARRAAAGARGAPGRVHWGIGAALAGGLIAAVVVCAHFYREAREARMALAQANAPQVNTRIVDLEITRAAIVPESASHTVQLPAQPAWIVLAMDTGSTAASERRARLVDDAERIVAESSGLVPDDLGIVYWSLHSSLLRAGVYEAQLGSAGDTEEPGIRFALRLLPPT